MQDSNQQDNYIIMPLYHPKTLINIKYFKISIIDNIQTQVYYNKKAWWPHGWTACLWIEQ